MSMSWDALLKQEKLGDPSYVQDKYRPAYRQDMDRILFSQPFRRLANKTQVHPLYDNDHIHHRLIHSLEAATVGHDLGVSIGSWLADEDKIELPQVATIAGSVQAACLAHDIGNPPFGHSGESAIGSWFAEQFEAPKGLLAGIEHRQRRELTDFEGNAQGLRILTRTEMYKGEGGLRLTLATLGAFMKYPVTAHVKNVIIDGAHENECDYIGIKKYGCFDNDINTLNFIAKELSLVGSEVSSKTGNQEGYWWRRHPLSFVMEAADDICYNIMDLEDAYLAGDIGFDSVCELLKPIMVKTNKAYESSDEQSVVSRFRAQAIKGAIQACAQAFKDNYDSIMSGEFGRSLVEASSLSAHFAQIKNVAKSQIFIAQRKTELEVMGRNAIHSILNGISPVMEKLAQRNWELDKLSYYDSQVVRSLRLPIAGCDNAYDAAHAMADFVSGMTDRYALKVAKLLGR